MRRLQAHGVASTVALVTPGGYGKSALLAEWAAHERRPFVWLALGLGRPEPAGLLDAIAAGLSDVHSDGAAKAAPERVHHGRRAAERAGERTLEDVVTAADGLARAGLEAVVVLDELESLDEGSSHELLAALVRRMPGCVTVALASRSDLHAGLGRLRAEDRVLELGPRDLEMTSFEAALLLEELGVELDEEALEVLIARTEGWPAAIHLAGRLLCERGTGYVAELSGADREIADYVREEILAPLATDRLARLRALSILEHMSGELCDAVLQSHGGGRLLGELAADGSMLVDVDGGGQWFRVHALVREVLRSELALCEPELVPALHARASDWFASRGMRGRALEHAAAGGDAALAGGLLLEECAALLGHDRAESAHSLNAFGARELAGSPELALAAALDALSSGDAVRAWQIAQPVTALAAGGGSPLLLGGLCAIEAAASNCGIERMCAAAERACELLGPGSMRALALLLRGVGSHLGGERDRAGADLEDAVAEAASRVPLLEALALSQLALVELGRPGDRAAGSCERALETLRRAGLDREPTAAFVLAVSAFVKSRRGVSDEAKRELLAARRMLRSLGGYMLWCEVEARVVMARASVRLADADEARSLLAEASRWARTGRPVQGLLSWIDEAWGEIDAVGADALTGPRSLTLAELRVLRFLPTHLSFREIGERLHVSGNTVKSQAHAVYAKLGASSRTQAVARASALGLIDVAVV